mmetsp:Transcript_14064/g.38462  ORF Transcript_14064/g.38462 Transcript_14064/m.38462 type:complete len:312 (+) Transcript_14064:695-1630(+)
MGEREEDDTEAPHVDFVRVGVARMSTVNLRSQVSLCSCISHRPNLRRDVIRQTEVYDLATVSTVEEDILEFQVPVNDLLRVDVMDRTDDLLEERPRFFFLQKLMPLNVAPKLASGSEFHDETNRIRVVCHIKDPNDVRMAEVPQRLYLLENALQVGKLPETFLRHEFHSSRLSCFGMDAFDDAAKSTLAKLLLQIIIADDLDNCVRGTAGLEIFAARYVDHLVFLHVVDISTLDAIGIEGTQRGVDVERLARLVKQVAKLGVGRQHHLLQRGRSSVFPHKDLRGRGTARDFEVREHFAAKQVQQGRGPEQL